MKGWKWWKCASFKNVVLGLCAIVNNGYQHDLRALHTFVPYRMFGQFFNIPSKNVWKHFWKYLWKPLIQGFHILKYG